MNPLSAMAGAAQMLAPEIPSAASGPPEPFGHQAVSQWGPFRATSHQVGWWQTPQEADEILRRTKRFHTKAPRMGFGIAAVATIAGCIFGRVGNARRKSADGGSR